MTDESRLDPAVVSALYLEHGEQLHRFLHGVLRDPQLAHDVLQATFMKAVQVGHTAQEETRKAWLFRVAYHEAMAVRRRQGVDGRAMQKIAASRNNTASAGDEPAIRFETVERVRDAIAQLPAAQRQVLRMRIYEEKTFAVIAEELGIPLGTALARMRAAQEKLRKHLAGEQPTD
ncbi:MAG: sigma-70 family RNA polymerase sigma factor [Planctomycetales bacterium]|nr:sigma-70 family RNA polymerase sigma factor [Planctomycetales bacterium]